MIRYDQLTTALSRAIPELRIPVETEKRWWKGEAPGQHVVFGNVLSPFLVAELQKGGRPDVLARAFLFLEEMAQSPDSHVHEVLQQSVLAGLCGDQPWSQRLDSLLGPKSKQQMISYCEAYHDHR